MEDRVKKSLWIITAIAALLISIICFIVTADAGIRGLPYPIY
jgi:hypothetical protein